MFFGMLLAFLALACLATGVIALKKALDDREYGFWILFFFAGGIMILLPLAAAEDIHRHRHDPPKTTVECPIP